MTQQDNFKKEAKAIGERFAILLVAADLPDDVKAGFASMIPEMNPEQLDRLVKILEANVVSTASTQEQELGESIQKAQSQYEQVRKIGEEKALKDLDEIENILNKSKN